MRTADYEWWMGNRGLDKKLESLISVDKDDKDDKDIIPVGKFMRLNLKTGVYENIPKEEREKKRQERCEMLEGNYKVALCRFLETKSNEPSDWDKLVTGQPFGKEYAYAVFPEDEIKPYDYALVIANGSLKIVAIDEIIDKADWDGTDVTKELICRVDTRPYIGRKECRKQAKKLKNQMDKMVKESQSILLYETLAAHNPELKTILDQYKNLTGYGDSK